MDGERREAREGQGVERRGGNISWLHTRFISNLILCNLNIYVKLAGIYVKLAGIYVKAAGINVGLWCSAV